MKKHNLQTLYQDLRQRLRDSGIENPDLETRLFMKHVLNVTDADLIGGKTPDVVAANVDHIDSLAKRRLEGEPLSRIVGEREFWSLPFLVTPAVLDPRPDTETVIQAALKVFTHRPPPASILDLGTGSGCILIALLHEWKQAQGTGVDISPEALEVAAMNARRNGVLGRARFIRSDWGAVIDQTFDLVTSNPPYIPSADIPNLQAEVRNHDPILALDGGGDGLKCYKIILGQLKSLLSPGGVCLLETGFSQAADVARLAEDAGFAAKATYKDIAGHGRVVEITAGEK